jgi:Domain of unknown function (DUF5658)
MINYILFSLFIILQFLDFWTTYNVIKSGKGHEANLVMAWLFDKIGIIGGFALAKSLAIIAMWFIKDVLFVIAILNIVYIYIIYSNYKIMKA